MATTNRPTESGAVGARPSQDPRYSSRGVFDNGGVDTEGRIQSSSDTMGGSIGESRLTPAFSGGGSNANDSTITLNAGAGIDGGGSFTTNQATNGTITFDLPDVFVPMTGQTAGTPIGTADNPIQSITVDEFGRVSSVTVQTSIPQPTPFQDNFSSSEDRTPRSASETPRMEDITLMVADGYTIDTAPTVTSTGDVPVTIGTPTGVGTNEITIPVTIPATQQPSDPVGTARVMTTSTVTETSSGRTREETATPIDVPVFIPFYSDVFAARQTTLTLSSLTASTEALTNGTPITLRYDSTGPRTQYAYLALETVMGRTYRFDAGFFDISADTLSFTARMFGRDYEFYEFPTRADLSFTIRF